MQQNRLPPSCFFTVHVRTTEGAFLRAYMFFLGTVSMRKFMVKICLICPRKKKNASDSWSLSTRRQCSVSHSSALCVNCSPTIIHLLSVNKQKIAEAVFSDAPSSAYFGWFLIKGPNRLHKQFTYKANKFSDIINITSVRFRYGPIHLRAL